MGVIPACARIHPAKSGTGPRIKVRGDGVIPANRAIRLLIDKLVSQEFEASGGNLFRIGAFNYFPAFADDPVEDFALTDLYTAPFT